MHVIRIYGGCLCTRFTEVKISPCLHVVMLLIPSAELIVACCAGHRANTVRAEWKVCKCYGTWYTYLPMCYTVLIKVQGTICDHEKLGLSAFT